MRVCETQLIRERSSLAPRRFFILNADKGARVIFFFLFLVRAIRARAYFFNSFVTLSIGAYSFWRVDVALPSRHSDRVIVLYSVCESVGGEPTMKTGGLCNVDRHRVDVERRTWWHSCVRDNQHRWRGRGRGVLLGCQRARMYRRDDGNKGVGQEITLNALSSDPS